MAVNTTSGRSIGDRVRLGFTVATTGGTATDSDVTLILQPPTGSVVVQVSTSTASTGVEHIATGSYRYEFNTTAAGDYKYQFRSTGTVTASTGGRIAVRNAFATT